MHMPLPFTDPKYKRFKRTADSKTFRNIVNTLRLGEKKVLDVGCSYGEHLVHFGKGSVGLTISPAESAYAQERNIDVRLGNIEVDNPIAERFDVVFANNIFEHLYSPHAFLIKIKKNLADDGVLILGVPSIPKIESLLRVPKFRGSLHPSHINFFTRTTLINTVMAAGWEVKIVRGFHFHSPLIDMLCNAIYPHFYVVATPQKNFEYDRSRTQELMGYGDKKYEMDTE